jgi:hypothetical protein
MVTKKEYPDRIEYRNKLGQRHREDGPAVEFSDGTKEWWINGHCHREDGPAIQYPNGDKDWYINSERHREDGPAIEWIDGDKWWFLNDTRYSEQEWQEEIIKIKLDRLKNYGN